MESEAIDVAVSDLFFAWQKYQMKVCRKLSPELSEAHSVFATAFYDAMRVFGVSEG